MKLRKLALQTAALALLALIAFNAYLAFNHLRRTQKNAALSLESSAVQADIAQIRQDFTDMETGQRGYLLTDDLAYLQPYIDARNAMATHLANLRSALSGLPASEQSAVEHKPSEQATPGAMAQQKMETQLESLAASMQTEIERTIALRQQGYRRRAIQVVQTNEGKQYMDRARDLVASLSSIENSRFASLEKARVAGESKTLTASFAANLCLLVLTAGLFMLIRRHERGLEREAARSKQGLLHRDSQLDKLMKLTSAVSDQSRTEIALIEENARLLLEKYDGFLPPAGYACAEQIKAATAQLEQLRCDLLGKTDSDLRENAA